VASLALVAREICGLLNVRFSDICRLAVRDSVRTPSRETSSNLENAMDMKQLLILTLQVSVFLTVFGFGLKTTKGDLSYLIHRPGLLVRSLLAVFVVMPVVAVLLSVLFNFELTVERALIALAVSPIPPLLPQKESKAGGEENYALALMAIVALIGIVVIPLEILFLQSVAGRPLEMPSGAVVRIVLISTLLPLAAGMAVRSFMPGLAARIEKTVGMIAKVLLPLAVIVLIVAAAPAMLALVGNGGILIAMVVFLVAGLTVGHVLGRPNPDHSVVLALSTACRHPAIALSIAAANFPEENFGATILLYVLLGAIVAAPYLAWHRRKSQPAPRPT
jgi:bile acid:Na+ symporter, BASS family